jgi:Helix-turn-helix domain
MEKRLLRVSEAAKAIGRGRTKTYELINRGLLEAVLDEGVLRVTPKAIEDYVQRLQEESKFVPSGGRASTRKPSNTVLYRRDAHLGPPG